MAKWTEDSLHKGRRGYSCWVRVNPDSDMPICVGPHEDAAEVCRIANLIEQAESVSASRAIWREKAIRRAASK